MKISRKQIEAVLGLPPEKRYEHFVKVVVDQEAAWGLYENGWALACTDSGSSPVFPLWPAREYAALCAKDEWGGYVPEVIPLDDLIGELLPKLSQDGVSPAIFYTPSDKGVVVEVDHLIADLDEESQRY